MKIIVVMEQTRGQLHKMSWETLAAAQQIGGSVSAAVVGSDVQGLAAELAARNLDTVYQVDHPLLADYTADGFTTALAELFDKTNPSLVLFPHTYQVRDFAPKLATRRGRVMISDVVKLRIDASDLVLTRQLFQGKLSADYRVPAAGPNFVSLQAGAARADQVEQGSAAAPVERITPHVDASAIRATPQPPFRESARAVDLTAAELIVSVGRGIREKENIGIVEDLAAAMGAELAASRPICDSGWLPMERQVGSSGQTVSPKVYLAVGISGAIQHQVGMKGSKCIVAINKDANAPIFEVADYGIVGDLFDVVPALTREVIKAKE
jgi:electron transfer flavoprotein alpha subunit